MRAACKASPELFYPAAALYAALVLPLSVFWMPQWHPREMLFGFALAVVAGNQLGAAPAPRVRLLFAVRLARWRLWAVRGRRDLLCLASGYAWLSLGLVAFGIAAALGRHESQAVHLITAGAIGTLTFNVMALSWLRLRRRDPAREPLIVAGTVLLAAAAVLRAAFSQYEGAALCWSLAFALLLALFFKHRRRHADPAP